jgi:hypothetical protein
MRSINTLVGDFVKSAFYVDGYGFFKGNRKAVRYAQTMSRSQIRKFKEDGKVPGAFYAYLRAIGAFKRDVPIPRGGSTHDELVHILRFYRGGRDQAKSDREYLLWEMNKRNVPILRDKDRGLGDPNWIKLETFGILRGNRIIFPKD